MASWTSFEHENILKFVGYSVSADFGTVSLITPYMAKGNVMDYIHREEVYYEGILELVSKVLRGLVSGKINGIESPNERFPTGCYCRYGIL